MNKVRIGIDNGVSGSIGIIHSEIAPEYISIPAYCKSEQEYTKAKQNVTRIQHPELKTWLRSRFEDGDDVKVLLERPMVNPQRFKATKSALRALESVLIMLEDLGLGKEFIDSKEWQKELLPKGLTGSPELKKASLDIGVRMFPALKQDIEKHGDADGILIAEHCRRKYTV